MRVEITPEFIKTDWYEDHGMNFYTDNGPEGTKHVIHTGGEYASYLQIPTSRPSTRAATTSTRDKRHLNEKRNPPRVSLFNNSIDFIV